MNAALISASTSVVISLAVIVLLLVIFSLLARRIRGRLKINKNNEDIEIFVKSKYSIGVQQYLIVVEIKKESFLLSVCKGGVSLISRLDNHD